MTDETKPTETGDADRPSASVAAAITTALSTPPVGLVLVALLVDQGGEPGGPGSTARAIAERLADETEPTDVIIGTGTDDRAIIRTGLTAPAEAEGLAYRLHAALSAPLPNGDGRAFCDAAIGVAVGRAGDTAADLLRHADHALGDARVLGGNTVVVFDDEDRDLLEP